MTIHRSRQARVDEILEAASRVIEEHGYERVTMERIIARTSLSKGGVYRFFNNRRAVVLALLRRTLERWTAIDIDAALSWKLPLRETITRLLFNDAAAPDEQRLRRLWLQLLPATVSDPDFAAERARQQDLGRSRYRELIHALLARDGRPADATYEQRLEQAIAVGAVFMEGAMLTSLSTGQGHELEQVVRQFVEVMLGKVDAGLSAPLSGAA